MSGTAICGECGAGQLNDDERVFIDPDTYCLDCFDATCARCDMSIVDGDDRVQQFDTYFCTECAERLCYDCQTYIANLESRNVVAGVVRCQECTWCFFGGLCCGCGTTVSDSTEMVVVNGSHQFCAECKQDLSDETIGRDHSDERGRKDTSSASGGDAPF